MVDFFDVNNWIKEGDFNHVDEYKKAYINKAYRVILTNYFSLIYHWDFGNEKLTINPLLMEDENIFFGFIITPDNYSNGNFEKYIINCYKKKVRLFRFFPKTHCFYIYDSYMKKIFNILDFYRFPVMLDLKQLDITGNKYFAIDNIEKVLDKNPNMPFILECSLKQLMFNSYFLPLLDIYENLYLEISGLLAVNQIEHYVKKVGSNRLIYGTNHPSIELEFTRDRILLSDLNNKEKEEISSNNLDNIIRRIINE